MMVHGFQALSISSISISSTVVIVFVTKKSLENDYTDFDKARLQTHEATVDRMMLITLSKHNF